MCFEIYSTLWLGAAGGEKGILAAFRHSKYFCNVESKSLEIKVKMKAPCQVEIDERRTSARLGVIVQADIEEPVSQRRIQGQTANVSVGGCFVEASESLMPGSIVKLVLGSETRKLHCNARVVHSTESGMGFCFAKFDAWKWLAQGHRSTFPSSSERNCLTNRHEPSSI